MAFDVYMPPPYTYVYETPSLKAELVQAYTRIKEESSFALFSLSLSVEEKLLAESTQVRGHKVYNNFGELEHLKQGLEAYFRLLGNQEKQAQDMAALVARKVDEILKGLGQETAWVTLRANNSLDHPRWHTDGYFFEPFEGLGYKAAFALKGPGTLCYATKAAQQPVLHGLLTDESLSPQGLQERLTSLVDPTQVQATPAGKGLLFVVGDPFRSAIHSEPIIQADRLFVSIVPGSHVQIQQLRERWQK
jgi:hypothetical protein